MNTCLTIVLPKAFEEDLLDRLLEHPEWAPGFTSTDVSGHGRAVPCHGPAEEVRGRAARVQVQVVLDAAHAQGLLEYLKQHLHSGDIVYWLAPVTEFGRFA
jgi:hypothetical protein